MAQFVPLSRRPEGSPNPKPAVELGGAEDVLGVNVDPRRGEHRDRGWAWSIQPNGRGKDRTCDLPRVKRALSR
jgi:hypothetical protein